LRFQYTTNCEFQIDFGKFCDKNSKHQKTFNFSGIDDPIGACSVHLIGGIWGQISVGLFAQNPIPLTSTNGRSGLLMGMLENTR
jgi:ammonia channel protein AmtB